mmetsp:Transcript_28612/g.61043  ORF Transcript_28612/g.61043 Transcript_28612/m.61043 type:complete len:86 (+) Transcript_28612:8-265(+)
MRAVSIIMIQWQHGHETSWCWLLLYQNSSQMQEEKTAKKSAFLIQSRIEKSQHSLTQSIVMRNDMALAMEIYFWIIEAICQFLSI